MVRPLLVLALAALVAVLALRPEGGTRSTTSSGSGGVSGTVRMVDADTLDLGAVRVRLHGVDAPEGAQACLDADGVSWPCGAWAADGSRALWDGRRATCAVLDTDRYGRAVARCAVGGEDLGARLVREGMALAYVAYSTDYAPEEAIARAARAGVWQGRFEAPWDWRAARRAGDDAGPCAIKGNVSEAGRLYHLPGGSAYARTRIDPARGERWFCSIAEAEAAGWRAARS